MHFTSSISVLNQVFNLIKEIICVDNNSIDQTSVLFFNFLMLLQKWQLATRGFSQIWL
jgi:hypothetical protein